VFLVKQERLCLFKHLSDQNSKPKKLTGAETMGYRYTYGDIACQYCRDRSRKNCPANICPHIRDNISDLLEDKDFCKAILDAENCDSLHKFTLLQLKACALDYGVIRGNEDIMPFFAFKSECGECGFPDAGFACSDLPSGKCMRDWTRTDLAG
jgi:hypothetical protein